MVRKQMVGVVVSDKMNKTINVAVRLERTHPKYGVKIRDTRKYMAHDEAEAAKVGDVVRIEEGRKRSKHKAFELREIIRSAPRFGTTPLREGTGFAAGRLLGLGAAAAYDEAVAAARAALGEGADGTKPVATGVGGDAPDAPEDDGFLDERIDDGTR
eukprot:PRCOL_00003156-RA